jgi:hypothetical protein
MVSWIWYQKHSLQSKKKSMELHYIKNLLQTKENNQQSEKTIE